MKEREAFLVRAMKMSVAELFALATPSDLSDGQKNAWERHGSKQVLDLVAEMGYHPVSEGSSSDFAHMSETVVVPFNPLIALSELLPEKDPRTEILQAA